MMLGNPLRDWRRGPVFHPPEAVLYLQLSPRRRGVGALFLGAGLGLAAALVAYGMATQNAWALGAALASAIAGFVAMWRYQSSVRAAQIVEDRARATTLFDAFDGRFDLGRVALTQAGVELDGESFSWASIYQIESTVADAMSKHVTLVLDAAHANRRISLSLAGLPELPGVAYAVVKMLWMRQITARNVAELLPRMRVRPSDLSPTRSAKGTLWMVFGLLAGVAGLGATVKLLESPRPWLAALSAGAGLALFFWAISQSTKANWRETARQQDRSAELETTHSATEDFVVRRRSVTRWPTIISLLCAAPVLIFCGMREWEMAIAFLMFASIVLLITWTIAWLLGSGVIATLTPTGIVLRGREISWHDIASLDLHFLPRIETGQLVIRLARPIEPRTLRERLSSSLSAGHSDQEIGVSLARSKEPPGAVLHLAQLRWERAIGTRRVDAAHVRQVAEQVHETRTWKQFSAAEKARFLWVGAGMFALLGFAVHGAYADFRASTAWYIASLVLSAGLSVWGCVATLRSRTWVRTRNRQGTPRYIALFFLVSLTLGVSIWSTIGQSWPDLATRKFGREVMRDVPYDKSGYRGRGKCPFPLDPRLDESWPYRFCANEAAYASLPAAGTLRLELRQSWFGVHIVSVSTIEN